ncbi:hypothetical protein D4R47_04785, partial [archaeon]
LDLANPAPPAIPGVSLPAGGATDLSLLDRFTLNFNEDIDPALISAFPRNMPLRLIPCPASPPIIIEIVSSNKPEHFISITPLKI